MRVINEVVTSSLEAAQASALLRGLDDIPAFVACFSALEDNLGQWRAYAGDGAGVALGVQVASLNDLRGMQEPDRQGDVVFLSPRFDPVEYDREKQADAVKACLAPLDKSADKRAIEEVRSRLILAAPFLEQRSFQEEQEWRLTSLLISLDQRTFKRPRLEEFALRGETLTWYETKRILTSEGEEHYGKYPLVDRVFLGPKCKSLKAVVSAPTRFPSPGRDVPDRIPVGADASGSGGWLRSIAPGRPTAQQTRLQARPRVLLLGDGAEVDARAQGPQQRAHAEELAQAVDEDRGLARVALAQALAEEPHALREVVVVAEVEGALVPQWRPQPLAGRVQRARLRRVGVEPLELRRAADALALRLAALARGA
ncbi:MAG: DUF2971 domain-containing protein [Planctomycetes bacterium]|nr:DUF2971 domain-containing protein [Planctomycetota bacterium]